MEELFMGHIALYREWRPRTFDEVVEQKHTVAALKQAVISGNIAHAYLFSGTRGTGKTTMAQIFSRAINCLSPENGNPCNKCSVCLGILGNSILDVIEMDAASNNNVDTIRRLCDEVVFTPSVARFKVYIIDEVHMLSTGAFNALLKTLEEPPAHAVFILATTEQHRIPATILSRCQRYEFRRIPVDSIILRLRKIADADGMNVTDDALKSIAQMSDGALRDAISLLDQAKASFLTTIQKEDILSLVGVVNDDFMQVMAESIADKAPEKALELVEQLILDGRDVVRFTGDLALYFRNVMICHVTKDPESLIYFPAKTIEGMKRLAAKMSLERVIAVIRDLSSLVTDLRWSSNPRITFEIALIRLMNFKLAEPASVISVAKSEAPVTAAVPVVTPVVTPVVAPVSAPVATPVVAPVDVPVNATVTAPAHLAASDSVVPQSAASVDVQVDVPMSPPVIAQDIAPEDIPTVTPVNGPVSNDTVQESASSINKVSEPDVTFNSSDDPFFSNLSPMDIPLAESTEPASEIRSEFVSDPFMKEIKVDSQEKPVDNNINTEATEPVEIAVGAPSIADIIEPNVAASVISNVPEESAIEIEDSPMLDLVQLWPKILDNVISVGQMTVYLFLLPAKPEIRNNKLFVVFEEKDALNCKELSSKQNVLIISKAVFTITGQHLEVFVRMSSDMAALSETDSDESSMVVSQGDEDSNPSDAASSLPPNIESLKNSAEGLGITFYMED
jgi:DNA polymerase III subunit gamma/tau